MFDNVNIDWHLSHEEGSTDFSDDETLEDHQARLNGAQTPDHSQLLNSPDKDGSSSRLRPMSVFNTPRSGGSAGPDWSRAAALDDSPSSYHGGSRTSTGSMPPPPPPQGKKPTLCK